MQIVANPFRIESRMEAMMQNLISLESAHQKLRLDASTIRFEKNPDIFRTSTYTPRLSPTLRIDDFAFVPSKLGNHFEVVATIICFFFGSVHARKVKLSTFRKCTHQQWNRFRRCFFLQRFAFILMTK